MIDTYGVIGNPRYLSEIIKEFIVRGKELYPQLFTYQSDWLAHIDEFGLNPTYTVSYTGQSIYAPNTLERPVKSAILKGSTKYRDIDTGEILETFEEGRNLELVSVKMPVLTTTGKNLIPLKEDWVQGQIMNGGGISVNSYSLSTKSKIKVKPNTKYTFSTKSSDCKIAYHEWEANGKYIKDSGWKTAFPYTFTTNNKAEYINLTTRRVSNVDSTVDNLDDTLIWQLEESSTATTYEPHKSNILSCLEPVELGSVGEVKDELNLLTQQLTQRTETRPYQEGDELNSEFVTDMTNTRYKLSQEVIKTVDLSILDQNGQSVDHLKSFNGGTHVYTSSLEGSLVPSVDISVVTNLEETLKICSLEGNTM